MGGGGGRDVQITMFKGKELPKGTLILLGTTLKGGPALPIAFSCEPLTLLC